MVLQHVAVTLDVARLRSNIHGKTRLSHSSMGILLVPGGRWGAGGLPARVETVVVVDTKYELTQLPLSVNVACCTNGGTGFCRRSCGHLFHTCR